MDNRSAAGKNNNTTSGRDLCLVHALVRHRLPGDPTGPRGVDNSAVAALVVLAVAALVILAVMCVDDTDLVEVGTVEPKPTGFGIDAHCPGAEAAEPPPELTAEGAEVAELVAA